MPFVPGFRPSACGLHFANAFPSVPLRTIDVGPVSVPIGNASAGLCGGMVYTVRDYYEAHMAPPPDKTAPSSGPLFDYMVNRLFDSFNLPGGPLFYLHLMDPALPDHETWASQAGLAPRGRAWVMIREQWPKIKADVDAGRLSPMGLVRVKSTDPMQLGRNHQVLAYGYDLNGSQLTIHIYDPNCPDRDDCTIALNISSPEHTTPVTCNPADTVYCFFRTDYAFATPPAPTQWFSLGGGLTSAPAVGRNADGRLEAFVRGTDNALYHIWQTAPNGTWSGWAGLGGVLTSGPAVGANQDGRLEVFVRGSDNGLYHMWQTAPNAGWSAWASLGGMLNGMHAVAANLDGRLEVFVRGTDNALWHISQTAPNGGWSAWDSLGGVLALDSLALGRNADGRLEVFVKGTDRALWHIWQTAPNGGWSAWSSLGGQITDVPAVGRNADGRLEVFVRGTDGAVWHKWQTATGGNWSDWASLGGVITSPIAVGSNKDGRLELFVRGTDGQVCHMWQKAPNATWSNWTAMGSEVSGNPTVAANQDGRLEVFIRSSRDNALWHRWQVTAGGIWV